MKTIEERFWSKVDKTGDCWEWKAGKADGYGRFCPVMKTYGAHRYSWEVTHGPIPLGMFVCHHCDNRGCVNPEHLFLGTAADNSVDMVNKKRSAIGSQHGRAKLHEDDIPRIKDMLRCGAKQRDIAKWFNVGQKTICSINIGRNWAHI